MRAKRAVAGRSQAWVELRSQDPEAVSALAVARVRLPAAARLFGLRRWRLFELAGALPERDRQEELLHRSSQFYNPHKEVCTLRADPAEPAPVHPGEWLVMVAERGSERRPAAERWWLHETGQPIRVQEAVVWALSFEPVLTGPEPVHDLVFVRGPRHGLLCNPLSQVARIADGDPPLPWMEDTEASAEES